MRGLNCVKLLVSIVLLLLTAGAIRVELLSREVAHDFERALIICGDAAVELVRSCRCTAIVLDRLAVCVQGSACNVDDLRKISLSVAFLLFVHCGLCRDLLWGLPRQLTVHFVGGVRPVG